MFAAVPAQSNSTRERPHWARASWRRARVVGPIPWSLARSAADTTGTQAYQQANTDQQMALRNLCWPLRSSAPPLLSVPHDETVVIKRSRHGFHAAVSAARADPPAILPRSSSARMSNAASTGVYWRQVRRSTPCPFPR